MIRCIFTGFLFASVSLITGCSIKQSVVPVELSGSKMDVCILRNDDVRHGFLEAYTDALKEKKIQVRTIPETPV